MDRLSNQTKHLMKLTQELLVSARILIFGGKKKRERCRLMCWWTINESLLLDPGWKGRSLLLGFLRI